MNLALLLIDNISEVLTKIVEFTQIRSEILLKNIKNVKKQGFIPEDLAVDEFSALLADTINEHAENQRLMFRDTPNIKFNADFTFEAKPITDTLAQKLLLHSSNEYLELQIDKLTENTLNQKIATELLRQKDSMTTIL